MDLAQGGSADWFTIADEAAAGVDREPATDLGGARRDQFLLLAVGAEAVLGHVDDVGGAVALLDHGASTNRDLIVESDGGCEFVERSGDV